MGLLVAMVIAAGIGWVLRYVLPHRTTYGVALTGGVSAAVCGLVWSGLLLWPGMTSETAGIWLISIGLGAIAAFAVPFIAGSKRPQRDDETLRQLMKQSA